MTPSIVDLFAAIVVGYLTIAAVPVARYWFNRQLGYKVLFAVLLVGWAATRLGRAVGDFATQWPVLSTLPLAPEQLAYDLTWLCVVAAGPLLYLSRGKAKQGAAKWVARRSGDLVEHLLQEAVEKRFFVELTMENGSSTWGGPSRAA